MIDKNDPYGLKKLDRDFTKLFKSNSFNDNDTNIITKKRKIKNMKLSENKDYLVVKSGVKYSKDVVKSLYKFATRNNIPNDYEDIMNLEEKLDREQIRKAEIERSIIRIKELKAQEKEFRRAELNNKIEGIKRFFHV